MEQGTGPPRRRLTCAPLDVAKAVVVVGFVVAWTVSLSIPPLRDGVVSFLTWLRDQGAAGAVLYLAVFSLAIVVCFPEVALAIAGGYVFTLPVASCLTWLGSVVGASVAFGLGRVLCRGFLVRTCLKRFAFLERMDVVLGSLGWRLGVIIRAPYVPFVHMNYILAASRLSYRDFLVSTAVGSVPGVVLYSYVGTSVRSLAEYLSGKESVGPIPVVLTACGVGVAVLAFVGLGLYARRVVARAVADGAAVPLHSPIHEGSDGDAAWEDGE